MQVKSLHGTVSISLISDTSHSAAACRDQRAHRGVRLAGSRAPSAAKEIRAHLGRADSWGHLGFLAFASLPVKRDSAERLVFHSIFYMHGNNQLDRDRFI